MSIPEAIENTDKEVWRDPRDSFNQDRIFVTEGGAVGLSFGGRCVVKPLREWVSIGWNGTTEDRLDRLENAIRELNPGLNI